MKSIMISVMPEWVAAILNGKKTLEIRKAAPKCKLPIDVYIYCTKKWSGRFVIRKGDDCYGVPSDSTVIVKRPNLFEETYGGKVVAKFTLDEIDEILNRGAIDETDTMYTKYFCGYRKLGVTHETIEETRLLKNAHLLYRELNDYLHGKKGYAWHITDLVIFDKPKKLNEFGFRRCQHSRCINCKYDKNSKNPYCSVYIEPLSKAPSSWCYVEKLK